MTHEQTTLFLGERLRDAGIAETLSHLERGEVITVVSAVLTLAAEGPPFNVNHIRARLAEGLRDKLDAFPNALGGIMRGCAQRDLIEKTGVYVPSSEPSARHRMIPMWREKSEEPR